MSVGELLTVLKQNNIRLTAEGGRLRYQGPAEAMTEEMATALRKNKPELLKLLQRPSNHFVTQPENRSVRHSEHPLSSFQQRIWLLEQIQPGNSSFNISAGVRAEGPFDEARLGAVIRTLISRHESLRTIFRSDESGPQQRILDDLSLSVHFLDRIGDAPEDALRFYTETLAKEPFSLESGPLFRVTCVRLATNLRFLLLTIHHIVADAIALESLVREFGTLYGAETDDLGSVLPPLPAQYADFCIWQASQRRSAVWIEKQKFWKQQIGNGLPKIRLPYTVPALSDAYQGRSIDVNLDAGRTLALKKVCVSHQVTIAVALLSAVVAVLSRYSSSSRLVMGVQVPNRGAKEFEGVTGYFVNHLPLIFDLGKAEIMSELLFLVRRTVGGAYENQEIPFEEMVGDLLRPGRSAQDALMPVMFNFVATSVKGFASRRCQFTPIELPKGDDVAAWWQPPALELAFRIEGDEILGRWTYNAARLSESTMAALVRGFLVVIDALTASDVPSIPRLLAQPELTALPEASDQTWTIPKICVASTFVAEPLGEVLSFWGKKLGVEVDFCFAGFGQVFQELLNPGGLLHSNHAGFNFWIIRLNDVLKGVKESDVEEVSDRLEGLAAAFRSYATVSTAKHSIVCLVPGNVDREQSEHEERRFLSLLGQHERLEIFSSADWLKRYPVTQLFDPISDGLATIPLTVAGYAALGTLAIRRFLARESQPHKVVAVDCDGTLWKGICAEDAPEGIEFRNTELLLQRHLVEQRKAGRLVCLLSKNETTDVEAVLKHRSEMLLSAEDVTASRINWEPKWKNLKELLDTLGFTLSDCVFIDNDPVECHEMKVQCPDVLTLELPEDEGARKTALNHFWAFDSGRATPEDVDRATMYRDETRRRELKKNVSLAQFIQDLRLQVTMEQVNPAQALRAAQLTQRTNQFNTNTIRRSEQEISSFCAGPNNLLGVEVTDRFGAYGLVGLAFLHQENRSLIVESLLLSCRALGRGIEHAMLSRIGAIACKLGCSHVRFPFRRTSRNRPAFLFLSSLSPTPPRMAEHADECVFEFLAQDLQEVCFQPAPAAAPETAHFSEPLVSASTKPFRRISNDVLLEIAGSLVTAEEIAAAVAADRASDSRLVASANGQPATEVEKQISEIWTEILRVQQPGTNISFFDFGGDSLLATRVLSRVQRVFEVEIPLAALFERDFTICNLAELVENARLTSVDDAKLDDLLNEMDRLSDDQVKALLSRDN